MSSREAPEDAIDFTQPWRFSDITFIVEEQKIYANKTVLSMWSPVMEAMFHSDFREKRAVEIDLPEKTFDDVVELMRVLHPPNADICGTLLSSWPLEGACLGPEGWNPLERQEGI